jgi:hypothetical protein
MPLKSIAILWRAPPNRRGAAGETTNYQNMPIRHVRKTRTHAAGYKWGAHGHVYASRAGAARQAAAAYAHGYRGR